MDNSRIALRFLGIPILLRIIGILKTRSTILELSVRVLGIGTIWEFLKCAVKLGHFGIFILFEDRSKLSGSVSLSLKKKNNNENITRKCRNQ